VSPAGTAPIGDPEDPELHRRIRAVRLAVFDFDGVFTSNTVYVFEDGREAVRCTRLDGIGLRKLEASGVEAMIVSTEVNQVVRQRAKKLRIDCVHGTEDKVAVVERERVARDLGFEQIAFLGNDVNDLPILERVGLPMVVRDAHPDVLASAFYQTRWLGGQGAVREVCDLFARVRGEAR